MPTTYEPIATTTLGSAQSSVTFSSISGSYTDLVLVCNPNSASGPANLMLEYNGNTATNYSWTIVGGAAGSALSLRVTSVSAINCTYYGYVENNLNQNTIINIQNYSNSTTNKTCLVRANNAGNGVSATVGLWRQTAAITSVKLYLDTATNFATGSTFTLYGIKAA
jgi:hypothetical protein